MMMDDTKIIRCAIYTRSATESEDREQTKAQRAQCEALIAERAGQGWKSLETAYDDSCVSGMRLDRPAFNRLLEDAGNGKFDCVVMRDAIRLHRGDMADHTDYLIGQFASRGVEVVFEQEAREDPAVAIERANDMREFLASFRKYWR